MQESIPRWGVSLFVFKIRNQSFVFLCAFGRDFVFSGHFGRRQAFETAVPKLDGISQSFS